MTRRRDNDRPRTKRRGYATDTRRRGRKRKGLASVALGALTAWGVRRWRRGRSY